jgi:hypothetical protein
LGDFEREIETLRAAAAARGARSGDAESTDAAPAASTAGSRTS